MSENLGKTPSPMKSADLGAAFGRPNRAAGLAGRLPQRTREPAPQETPTAAAEPADVDTGIDTRSDSDVDPDVQPDAGPVAEPGPDVDPEPRPRAQPPSTPPRQTRRTRTTEARPTQPAQPTSGAVQPTVAYMDADLANRLRKASRESGDTHTEIVLAALDATHETLTFGLQEPSSSLFAGRGAPRPQRHTGPQVQIALRPRRDDLAVIDQLVERLNAPNRSALIAAALERHLPQ